MLYPNIFKGIGKFQGEPYIIRLYSKMPPRHIPHRPVPVHLETQFIQQIQEMTESSVIKKVESHEFTPWISSYVLVETTDKEGKPKLRICLDPAISTKQSYENHTSTLHLTSCLLN